MSLYPSALGLYVTHTRRETLDAESSTPTTPRPDETGGGTRPAALERDLDAAWTISVDDYFDHLVSRTQSRPWRNAGASVVRLGRAAVETALVTGIGIALAAGALLLR